MVVRKQLSPARRQSGVAGLVALMVVALLIVGLTVLMVGHLGKTGRQRDREACRKNLQEIYLALSIYQNDNRGAFPFADGAARPAAPLSLLVPRDTTETRMFICPGSADAALPEAESFASRKISYAYYMGWSSNDDPGGILLSDQQVDAAPKKAGQQIFSADGRRPGNNHDNEGGNLLWRGGEVNWSGPKAERDVLYPSSVRMLNPQ